MSNLSITSSTYSIGATSTVGTSRIGTQTETTDVGAAGGSHQCGDTKSLSPAGKLFSDLQALQQSDPAKFKSILSDISSKLSGLAKQGDANSPETQILNDLSQLLDQVSQSGDLSQLLPPKPKKSHHAYAKPAEQSQQANLLQLLNGNSQSSSVSSSTQDILATLVQSVGQAAGSSKSSAI